MFTTQEFRSAEFRRGSIVLAGLLASAVALFASLFLLMNVYRESIIQIASDFFGPSAADWMPPLMTLSAVLGFLILLCMTAGFSQRFNTVCSTCKKGISMHAQEVLVTRVCPGCESQVIVGRIRSKAVYWRHKERQTRTFLKYWLWGWAIFSMVFLGYYYFSPKPLQRCVGYLFMLPLIGTASAGWSWIRTRDRDYLSQFLLSAQLLVLGVWELWRLL